MVFLLGILVTRIQLKMTNHSTNSVSLSEQEPIDVLLAYLQWFCELLELATVLSNHQENQIPNSQLKRKLPQIPFSVDRKDKLVTNYDNDDFTIRLKL